MGSSGPGAHHIVKTYDVDPSTQGTGTDLEYLSVIQTICALEYELRAHSDHIRDLEHTHYTYFGTESRIATTTNKSHLATSTTSRRSITDMFVDEFLFEFKVR